MLPVAQRVGRAGGRDVERDAARPRGAAACSVSGKSRSSRLTHGLRSIRSQGSTSKPRPAKCCVPAAPSWTRGVVRPGVCRPCCGDVGRARTRPPHSHERCSTDTWSLDARARWPGPRTPRRTTGACEFYFTDEDCMQQFLASPHFSKVLGLGTQHGEATTVIAVDPQEVFFTTVGRQPISQGWRDLYADQSATS